MAAHGIRRGGVWTAEALRLWQRDAIRSTRHDVTLGTPERVRAELVVSVTRPWRVVCARPL
jgi:hypothetical protein